MRLIDADKIIDLFEEIKKENSSLLTISYIIGFQSVIYAQPTAYDVDKVLKQLEDEKSHMSLFDDELEEIYKSAIDDAIEIVKASGMNNNSKISD